jgi:hypothetical protein
MTAPGSFAFFGAMAPRRRQGVYNSLFKPDVRSVLSSNRSQWTNLAWLLEPGHLLRSSNIVIT